MELRQLQQELEQFDNGDLGSYYVLDERQIHLFRGLHYSPDRQEWFARFEPLMSSPLPYREASYPFVLRMGQVLTELQVKPSQCYRALKAFGFCLDLAVANLTSDF